MKTLAVAVALGATLLSMPAQASSIVARIDISAQRMDVFVDGFPRHSWPVSTARSGYVTPTGAYRAQRLERMWYSRKYDNSPMPHSIFFHGGYAIHGTNYVKRLGTPASHGCVRLHPSNAAELYSLVRANGMASTQIIVSH
jgi:lipoprotein-anchoring transpeptidase ErfK/SrfK